MATISNRAHSVIMRIAVACLCTYAAGCTPAHNVKPLPNFVEMALKPGDKVNVTTHDGESYEFVVTEIRDGAIVGESQQIPLSTIATLKKMAWSKPESPCGGDKPLGCSVPLLISLASDNHIYYRKQFYDACAQHDYCYRHGYRTYGVDRQACDGAFLEDMRAACPVKAGNIVTKTIQLLDDSVSSRGNCLATATGFYAAVRRYGEDKFGTDTSTYCEYDGPPSDAVP